MIDIKTAYGFLLTSIIGLGLAPPNNVSIPYTVLDGARYERTTKPPRAFSLAGRFQGQTPAHLDRLRSDFRAAVDRDLSPIQQPMLLFIEPRDDCGNPTGDFATVPCIYAGGLEGVENSAIAEDAAPTFVQYIPFLQGGDAGASLTVQLSIANADYMTQRTPTGVWSVISGMTGAVNCITIGPDGKLYVGANGINIGGNANADYIAVWDGSSWSALGTGTNDQVRAIAFDTAGNLYAAGDFSLAGGVANTSRIAKWNGSAWSALSTGLSGGVSPQGRALAFDSSGNLYVGGAFTDAGGSGADYIAKWNGAAFSVVGSATALNNTVHALAFDTAGNLYVAGAFTDAGGVAAADRVAKWSGSAWSAVGPGMDNTVNTIVRGANGVFYAGGSFTTIGTAAIPYIAQWNGTGWSSVGTLNNSATRLAVGRGGQLLYAAGDFTTANGVTLPDQAAQWNGSTWLPLDIDLPGAAGINVVTTAVDTTLYLGYKQTGTAVAAATTTVTNPAPGIVWPRLVIKGPSSGTASIYQFVNYTTNQGIWLRPYTIKAGETATLNTDPQNFSFRTDDPSVDDGGNLMFLMLPGSTPNAMYLAPGSNIISFYSSDSTVTATLSWPLRYNGDADLVQ